MIWKDLVLAKGIEVLDTITHAMGHLQKVTRRSIDVMLKIIKTGLRRIVLHFLLC